MPQRFRKKPGTGRDSRIIDGRRVNVGDGEIITVENADALSGVLDKYEAVDPPPPDPLPTTGLKIVARGRGWFDVVNEATQKPLNEHALRLDEAEHIVNGDHPTDPEDAGE